MSRAKVKSFAYIVLGFAISWILMRLLNSVENFIVIGLIPFIGFLHELLHLIASMAVRATHKFALSGLLVGFKVTTKSVEDFIAIALLPQIISIMLFILYILLESSTILALMLIHVAISVEDLSKVAKYLIVYYK